MNKITIVVPFYNVEDYIAECLKSLIKQTYSNIEILCIDDGSSDDSYQIVESFSHSDTRIKIFRHNDNKGLGGARNTGIKNASGDFICFIDSDDYISENFTQVLLDTILQDDSDVCACNFWQDINGNISPYETNYKDNKFEVDKNNSIDVAKRVNPGCTNKLFKLDLLRNNNIYQPEQRYYEGVVFWLKTVFYSSRISTTSKRLYFYRQRPGSIMKSLTSKHIDDRFYFIGKIEEFVNSTILINQDIDTHKIIDDTVTYILRHLSYGNKLINESALPQRKYLVQYFKASLVDYSLHFDIPATLTAYQIHNNYQYLENKRSDIKHKLASAKEHLQNMEQTRFSKHMTSRILLPVLAISVILNAVLFLFS